MEEKTFYIDIEQLSQSYGGVPGIGVINGKGEALKLVCAGKTILSMPASDRHEKAYQVLAEEYDVRFIFDDEIPKPEFYPIPQLGIFAVDSLGGCFGSTNVAVDISEEEAPVYYINNELQCYRLAANMLGFIQLIVFRPDWKNGLAKDVFLAAGPSPGGKEYLVKALNLKRNNTAPYGVKDIKDEVVIYPSLEASQKEVVFYDIGDILEE